MDQTSFWRSHCIVHHSCRHSPKAYRNPIVLTTSALYFENIVSFLYATYEKPDLHEDFGWLYEI